MHNPCVRSLGFYRGGVHRRGGQSSKCDSDRAARDHDRPKPHAMLAKLKSAGVVHSFPPHERKPLTATENLFQQPVCALRFAAHAVTENAEPDPPELDLARGSKRP